MTIDIALELATLGKQAIEAIISHIDSSGRIIDPDTSQPSPPEHYAYTFAGWACLNIGNTEIAETLLNSYLALSNDWEVHSTFNTFALAEIMAHERFEQLSPELRMHWIKGIAA